MDNKKLLGKRLKEIRKKRKLTQEKLAELIGVEPASICNIENGYNYPSFQNLEKILRVLNCSFIEIFNFEQHQDVMDLKQEIFKMLDSNPEKIRDTYKIVKALIQ